MAFFKAGFLSKWSASKGVRAMTQGLDVSGEPSWYWAAPERETPIAFTRVPALLAASALFPWCVREEISSMSGSFSGILPGLIGLWAQPPPPYLRGALHVRVVPCAGFIYESLQGGEVLLRLDAGSESFTSGIPQPRLSGIQGARASRGWRTETMPLLIGQSDNNALVSPGQAGHWRAENHLAP